MPKMKTNKMASKKFQVNASGKVKRGQANTSHNTAKMSPKRRRQLRGKAWVEGVDIQGVKKMLPYSAKK